MKEAARFLTALLTENENGQLWLCPSISPENNFIYQGKHTAFARTAAMTMAIIRELFTNCIQAARIIDRDLPFAAKLEYMLPRLFPFQIGSKGQLLEWDDEYEESEPHHRHVSHLYGLHPGRQISPDTTPELAAACRKSLELRGDDGTGWSLAWKVNLWARLHDGDRALRLLNNQLRLVEESGDSSSKGGTYPNMFGAHPPFQIDGNFGILAGIAEMFLQNTETGIHILPALPSSWKKGRCLGLCAKRRIKTDIFWNNDQVKVRLTSPIEQRITFRCKAGKNRILELKAGEVLTIHNGCDTGGLL
jgi:alpha-L-fucosidase 2